MQRRLIQFGYIFLILIILVLGYQMIQEVKIKGEFTIHDLKPVEFTDDNYFYMLFALLEPPDVNIESREIKDKYRHLFYIAKSDHKYQTALSKEGDKHRKIWKQKRIKGLGINVQGLYFTDQMDEIKKRSGYIKELIKKYQVVLDRFESFINKDNITDCLPLTYKYNWISQLVVSYLPRLYLGKCMLEIHESGDFVSGTHKILQLINAGYQLIKSARIENSGYFLYMTSIYFNAINNIIRLQDCPPEVNRLIIKELPVLNAEDLNQKNRFIYSYLSFKKRIIRFKFKYLIFLPKRKILTVKSYIIKTLLKGREMLPFQNQMFLDSLDHELVDFHNILDNRPLVRTFIRRNELSKYSIIYPFRYMVINNLVRIIAEYKLRYDQNLSIDENFKKLDTYKKYPDPFTGEPYRINLNKGYIYSIGTDFVDDKDDDIYYHHKDIIMRFK